MGIVRGIEPEDAQTLLDVIIRSGLETIEVTMNTPAVSRIISEIRSASDNRVTVGAGTVLSVDDLNKALDAGASFIVMPVFLEDIVKRCVDKNIPVFPGAFTPQEAVNAWQQGASMVKIFPVGIMGPRYIKDLKGPFDKMELMAVGGIHLDNVEEYFACGADAVAFGASVFRKEWIDNKDFASIEELIKKYVQKVKQATSNEI